MNNFESYNFSLNQFITNETKFSLQIMDFENFGFLSKMETSSNVSFQDSFIYQNQANDIFLLIDRLKLILFCIKQQNDNIKRLIKSELKSLNNYEKIKLVDLIKLLIINRNTINLHMKKLFSNNSYFLNEVLNSILEFDRASYFCVDYPINELELTNDFRLSIGAIDFILDDCGFDLLHLHKLFCGKITDFDKKQNSLKDIKQCKFKMARFMVDCNKILICLNEICQNLNCISKILNRLFSGYQCTINFKYFGSTGEEISEFSVETNPDQFQRIVNFKYFLLELEKKVMEYILAIMEVKALNIVKSGENDKFSNKQSLLLQDALSPIRNSVRNRNSYLHQNISFLSSTPVQKNSPTVTVKHFSVLSNSMENLCDLNEKSLISLDSGYLLTPGNDQSGRNSYDNFDIIPFSDDEYEKIEEGEFPIVIDNDSDLCESVTNSSEYELILSTRENDLENSNSLTDYHFSAKEFCIDNNICHISKVGEFLFLNKVDRQDCFELFYNKMNSRNLVFDNDDVINNTKLCPKIDEVGEIDMKTKKMILMNETEWESCFNTILKTAIFNMNQNILKDEQDGLEYILKIWKSYHSLFASNDLKSKVTVDNQFNNNACTPYQNLSLNTATRPDKQNTNNNANSKDEDSAEQNTTKSIDQINNDESMILDNDLEISFKKILINSTSSEVRGSSLYSNSKFASYRDVCVNDSTISSDNDDFTDSNSSYKAKPHQGASNEDLGFIDDLELVVKLSELHLRSEFESEQHNQSIMIYDKNRIVDNYKIVNSQFSDTLRSSNFSENSTKSHKKTLNTGIIENSRIFDSSVNNSIENQKQISIESPVQSNILGTINENDETDFSTSLIVECSLKIDCTDSKDNYETKDSSSNVLSSSDVLHRISQTVTLTKKLLNITQCQLSFMFTLLNKNSFGAKATILRNRSLSVYALRKRLKMTIKILWNLRFATSRKSNNSSEYFGILDQINKLYDESENLVQMSCDFEKWMKKNGCDLNKIEGYNFEHELPNDMLIKMDPNDFEMVLSISTHRLQTIICALSHYPCYNYLRRLSLLKNIPILSNRLTLNHNIGNYLNDTDLLPKLCKLRRITAICALNIVDLHVLLTRLSNECYTDSTDVESKTKDLLIIWRAVDGECHRLLCCTSMIHHVLTQTKRSYIELISLIVVMDSILRTIPFSDDISETMKTHINSLMNYQERISSWIEEVEMCISIIYLKRITNKRFKYYDDIHKYLNENISTISELVTKIKKDFKEAVNVVNDIVNYCASLQQCSLIKIGKMLNSDELINNQQFLLCKNFSKNISDSLFKAIIDLEELTIRLNKSISTDLNVKKINNNSEDTRELLDRSQAIFEFVVGEISNMNPTDFSCSNRFKEKIPFSETCIETLVLLQNDVMKNLTEMLITEELIDIISTVAINIISLVIDEYQNDCFRVKKELESGEKSKSKITKFFDDIFDNVLVMVTNNTVEEMLNYKNEELEIVSEILLQEKINEIIHRTVRYFENQMESCRKDMVEYFSFKGDFQSYCPDSIHSSFYLSTNKEISNKREVSELLRWIDIDNFQIYLRSLKVTGEKVCDESNIEIESSELFSSSKFVFVAVEDNISEFDQVLMVNCPCLMCIFTSKMMIHFQTPQEKKIIDEDEKINVMKFDEICQPNFKIKIKNFNKRNNKISHLVAHFNQNSIEKVSQEKSPLLKLTLEQIFLNILKSQSNQIIEELATDLMIKLKINSAITSNIILKENLFDQLTERNPIKIISARHQEHVNEADILSLCDKASQPQSITTCPTLCNMKSCEDFSEILTDLESTLPVYEPKVLFPLVSPGKKLSFSLKTESVQRDYCKIILDEVINKKHHRGFDEDILIDESTVKSIFHSPDSLFTEHSEASFVNNFTNSMIRNSSNNSRTDPLFDVNNYVNVGCDGVGDYSIKKVEDFILSKSIDSLVIAENSSNYCYDITCRQGDMIDKRLCSEKSFVEYKSDLLHFKKNILTKQKRFNSGEIHNKHVGIGDYDKSDENETDFLKSTHEHQLNDKDLKCQESDDLLFVQNDILDIKTVGKNRLDHKNILNKKYWNLFENENNNKNNFSENISNKKNIGHVKQNTFSKISVFFTMISVLLFIIAMFLFIIPQLSFNYRFSYSIYPRISASGVPV